MVARELKFNAIANMFPLMEGADFDGLVEDIRKHGLREPIVIHKGEIVDGRNRYLACQKAGVKPRFADWDGEGSLIAFIVSVNIHRRHMDPSQLAMLAAQLSCAIADERKNSEKSRDSDSKNSGVNLPPKTECPRRRPEADTAEAAAALVGVSEKSVKHAKRVLEHGAPALVEAVTAGIVTVSDAAKIVDEPKAVQRAAVKAVEAGEAKTVAQAAAAIEATDEPDGIDIETLAAPYRSALNAINKILREFKTLSEDKRLGAHLANVFGRVRKGLDDAKAPIAQQMPTAVCTYCKGNRADCKRCLGTGFFTKLITTSLAK